MKKRLLFVWTFFHFFTFLKSAHYKKMGAFKMKVKAEVKRWN